MGKQGVPSGTCVKQSLPRKTYESRILGIYYLLNKHHTQSSWKNHVEHKYSFPCVEHNSSVTQVRGA